MEVFCVLPFMAINQLKAGAFLSYISIGLNNIVGLLYTPYMLRMLGQNEYGLYSLVASVVAYLTILDLGFANAIVRYTAKFRADGKVKEQYEMFGMFLVLYSFIGIVAFSIGLGIYANVDHLFDMSMTAEDLEKIRVMMLLMCFNLAFTFPMSIWGAVITAYENFVFQKLVNIVRIVLNPLVMVVLLSVGYKAVAMVVVTTLFNVLTLSVNAWYCFYRIRIKVCFGHFSWGFLREISVYSFWIFLDSIVSHFYSSVGQIVLGIYRGATTVAIYALAIQLKSLFTSFSTALNSVLLPKVTALAAREGTENEISDLFIRVGRLQYFVMSFILVGFIIFGKEFIILWGGEDYVQTYYITLIIMIPFFFDLISNVGIVVLQAKDKLKYRSAPMIMISLIGLMSTFPFANYFGIYGCACAISISIFVSNVLVSNFVFYKIAEIDVVMYWKQVMRMSLFPLFVIAFCFCLKFYISIISVFDLCVSILAFSAIYVLINFIINMNDQEKSQVFGLIRKVNIKLF